MQAVKTNKKWITFATYVLLGGTMYKLYFMDGPFYVQMQEFMGLSHTQIGLIYSMAGWATTIGFLLATFFSDRFSKKKLIPFAMMCNGLAGLYLSTFPTFNITLVLFICFALCTDMLCWPTLLKGIRLLGDSKEQGRLFGFLETGRGIIDTIVNFSALAVFVALGSGAFGFKGGIIFLSAISIAVSIVSYFVLEDDVKTSSKAEQNKDTFKGIKEAFKSKEIWIVSLTIFNIYAVYSGIKYFIPFLEEIYSVPIALVSAYGIINQYALKMVGGPIGGFITDKVTHSASKFIMIMFVITAVSMGINIILPHGSMNVYVATIITLVISSFLYCMRAVFFAPMDEVKVPRRITGAAMSLGAFIGYMPSMFIGVIYGSQLDANPGIDGYKIVFTIMTCIAAVGIITSFILVKVVKSKKDVEIED